MLKEFFNLIQALNDPSVSSSVIPFLVILTVGFAGALFATIKLVLYVVNRVPKQTAAPVPSAKAAPEGEKYLNTDGKFRESERPVAIRAAAPAPRASNGAEIERLRETIRKLEQVNAMERELQSKTMRKLTEAQAEIKRLQTAADATAAGLEKEKLRGARLEGKVAQLENQLRDAMRETARMYQQNAAALEAVQAQTAHAAEPEPELVAPANAVQDFTPEPQPEPAAEPLVAPTDAEVDRAGMTQELALPDLADAPVAENPVDDTHGSPLELSMTAAPAEEAAPAPEPVEPTNEPVHLEAAFQAATDALLTQVQTSEGEPPVVTFEPPMDPPLGEVPPEMHLDPAPTPAAPAETAPVPVSEGANKAILADFPPPTTQDSVASAFDEQFMAKQEAELEKLKNILLSSKDRLR